VKDINDVRFLNNLDKSLKNLISHIDSPITVAVHTDSNSKHVLIEGLCFPFVIINKEFRGAKFNHKELKSKSFLTNQEFRKLYCK